METRYDRFVDQINKYGFFDASKISDYIRNDKYFGDKRFISGDCLCIAHYKNKPVFGYLKISTYSGMLHLHRMNAMSYNSFAGSEAEDGDWILFSALQFPKVIDWIHHDDIKKYAENVYKWSNEKTYKMSMKTIKKNTVVWETRFKTNFPAFSDAIIKKDSIEFNGTTWGIKEFKEYVKACRVIINKHDKEYSNSK